MNSFNVSHGVVVSALRYSLENPSSSPPLTLDFELGEKKTVAICHTTSPVDGCLEADF